MLCGGSQQQAVVKSLAARMKEPCGILECRRARWACWMRDWIAARSAVVVVVVEGGEGGGQGSV